MVVRGTWVRSNEQQSAWRTSLAIVAALGCLATAASAQGRTDYFNVETPVGQGLAVARLANHDYLLVCNTPDNSVEVWDTNETLSTTARFLARIPVGLEPNSILWNGTSRAYVTCFLSDSVTSFTLSAPTGPASLTFDVDLSRNVGDEPMDLALTPSNAELLVSFGSKSAIGAFDPSTLDPLATPTLAFPAPTDNLLLEATISSQQMVIKEPRAIEISPAGSALFVLNHKGGSSLAANGYDFDLYGRTLSNGTVTSLSGLGSTNWNMRFASDGNLYVVGGEALFNLQGGPAVAAAGTGFVKSTFYRVENAGGVSPVVRVLDLNATTGGGHVAFADALTMPTDVVVLDGTPPRAYLAAFGSDRVGVVTLVNPADPTTWTIARIAIPVATGSTNTRSGPRALVFKSRIIASYDPGNRVYVLNRLDNSFSSIATNNNAFKGTIALHQDPTPAHIREGRPFLYSADLSANGFDSCASCHVDGRTDSIAWNLGSPTGFGADFLRSFMDSPSTAFLQDVLDHIANGYSPNKGLMVTQTLQGLLDTEVAQDVQDFVTNGPYHWRGDRAKFTDFNEAFADLLGLGCNFGGCGAGDLPMGIDPADMSDFEEFVNSIHYPPNPQQLETRTFSGDVADVNDEATGSGALRGMKLFHMRPITSLGGRGCVQCHALPRGSNLKFTLGTPDFDDITTPLESAQLRGLFQREKFFQVDGYDLDVDINGVFIPNTGPLAAAFGNGHAGNRASVNGFINIFNSRFTNPEQLDLNEFVHELDWGVAPVVGKEQRVVLGNVGSVGGRLDVFEAQVALGNAGLAVNGKVASGMVGYWYDPTRLLYALETNSSTTLTRAALLALVTSSTHHLYFRCTPLGSDRRVAALDGSSTPMSSSTPSNLKLLPMTTNTAWAPVPSLTHNWSAGTAAPDFMWAHPDSSMPTPRFLKAIRRFQKGLITAANSYGLTARRHDAPRRFRVAGDNIVPGAKLVLWTPLDTSGNPPNTGSFPDPAKTRKLEFPLYATDDTSNGHPVWETAVELAPIQYYTLMNGGLEAPSVRATLDDLLSTLPDDPTTGNKFDPDKFNWHYVQVQNGGLTSPGNGGWFQLTMQ